MGVVDLHSDIQLDLAREGADPRKVLLERHLPEMADGDITVRILCTLAQPPDPTVSAFRYIAATRAAGCDVATRFSEIGRQTPSFLLGLEGAEPYGTDLSLVEAFHWEGVRIVGLAWMNQNAVTGTCGEPNPGGITSFGRKVLRRVEELGAIVDLAHISDAGFYDVLECYDGPLMCSHTCARSLREHSRNITDDQARRIVERNGIIGVCFFSDFLGDGPENRTMGTLVDHIEHFIGVVGEDYVAVGPDWCDYAFDIIRPLSGLATRGVDTYAGYAEGVEDPRGLPRLEAALTERGLPARKILETNALRFLRESLRD